MAHVLQTSIQSMTVQNQQHAFFYFISMENDEYLGNITVFVFHSNAARMRIFWNICSDVLSNSVFSTSSICIFICMQMTVFSSNNIDSWTERAFMVASVSQSVFCILMNRHKSININSENYELNKNQVNLLIDCAYCASLNATNQKSDGTLANIEIFILGDDRQRRIPHRWTLDLGVRWTPLANEFNKYLSSVRNGRK